MKTYWDSSALVKSSFDPALKQRLETEGGFTRSHNLAETFSTFTANPRNRMDANDAARLVEVLAKNLEFIDLTAAELLRGLHNARRLGVRGGRVHDYLHALAAEKGRASKILTLDRHDFDDITTVPVELA